jgi:hypothetical protein
MNSPAAWLQIEMWPSCTKPCWSAVAVLGKTSLSPQCWGRGGTHVKKMKMFPRGTTRERHFAMNTPQSAVNHTSSPLTPQRRIILEQLIVNHVTKSPAVCSLLEKIKQKRYKIFVDKHHWRRLHGTQSGSQVNSSWRCKLYYTDSQ